MAQTAATAVGKTTKKRKATPAKNAGTRVAEAVGDGGRQA